MHTDDRGHGVDVLVYDERERRYVPAPVAALLALAAAVLAGAVVLLMTWGGLSPRASSVDGAAAGAVAAPTAQACRSALERAAEALATAEQVRDALADQTLIMNDLLAERVEPRTAVQRALPSLTRGARHSVQLDVGRQRYDEAAQQCAGG